MIAKYTMTGSQIKVEGLNPNVGNITGDPDIDPANINPESFGMGRVPEIMIRASQSNSQTIFLAEYATAPADEQWEFPPGDVLSMDYSTFVKTMNIFYITGTA